MSPVIRHSGRGKEMTGYSSGRPRPGIVGAAIVPHAPQFLTLPETEDKAQVARVNAAMRDIGDRFRALDPDLVIVISNAHCDDFVVRCVPAFALHCGTRADGNLRYLMSFDGAALDKTGNVECRGLQILAGMIGDRPPQSAVFEPSWHHIYAVIGWTDLMPAVPPALHYPATAPERSALAGA